MTTQDRIKSLHDLYCRLTGMTIPLTMPRIYQWEFWLSKGFEEKDLYSVIRMLNVKISQGIKTITCLKFHYLIGNIDWFEEDLAEANALKRRPPPETPRQEILRATGRPKPEEDTCRTAAQVLDGIRAFEQFKALRNTL